MIYIRVASEADIRAMHRIRMSVRENQLADAAAVQPRHYRAMLMERGRGWVAEVGGEIAGFAVADRKDSNIWALFVDLAFEGCGLGRRLHDTMMDWFFAAGDERVWLSTDPGTRAERFYRCAGWRHTGRETNGEMRYELCRDQWLARAARPRGTYRVELLSPCQGFTSSTIRPASSSTPVRGVSGPLSGDRPSADHYAPRPPQVWRSTLYALP